MPSYYPCWCDDDEESGEDTPVPGLPGDDSPPPGIPDPTHPGDDDGDAPPPTDPGEPGGDEETPEERKAAEEKEVTRLVNVERSKRGLVELEHDDKLTEMARAYSKRMADEGFFDHIDPEGHDPEDRYEAAGLHYYGGQNIARGYDDAAAVVDGWMHSPGHKANILRKNIRRIGNGVFFGPEGGRGPWWTQNFAFAEGDENHDGTVNKEDEGNWHAR